MAGIYVQRAKHFLSTLLVTFQGDWKRWSSMREHIFTKVKYRLGCVLHWFFRRRIFNCPVLFLSCCLFCVNQKIRRVKVEWIR